MGIKLIISFHASLKCNSFGNLKPISSNGGHIGWMSELSDKILKGDNPWTILALFGIKLAQCFQRSRFSILVLYQISLTCIFSAKENKLYYTSV